MRLVRLRRGLLPLAALAALALGGCASTAAEPGAGTFYSQHHGAAVGAATAVRAMESRLAATPSGATRAQRAPLEAAALRAKRRMVPASEWAGPERGEEENLQQAETEVSEAAQDVLKAVRSLRRYARTGSASSLSSYRSQMVTAREKWNEGITQLWYLAHQHDPPTI